MCSGAHTKCESVNQCGSLLVGKEVRLTHSTNDYPCEFSLLPTEPLDLKGLKFRSPLMVKILGYATIEAISMSQWVGPTTALSGDTDSWKTYIH